MSEPAAPAAPAVPAPQHEGPLERFWDRVTPRAQAAETEAKTLTAEFAAAVQDHSGVAFDVAGDIVQLLHAIDPNDDHAVAAVAALLPKAVALAGTAAKLAGAVL